jgi:pimeloyl-ACP methyl ester carboxylesterase
MTQTLEHVVSQDGTAIAFRRVGTGPPVVVMRGALGTSLSWLAVAERLADRFEFLLVDRRGPRLLPGIASVWRTPAEALASRPFRSSGAGRATPEPRSGRASSVSARGVGALAQERLARSLASLLERSTA